MQYEFRGNAIVYGIKCLVTGMIYVGSTLTPGRRWFNHLVTGENSNTNLQEAIQLHGTQNFAAYVFEVVTFPSRATLDEKKAILRKVEQVYINKFPKAQLYNKIKSSNTQ
jgi:group I intron endonuclease